ncbi:MAG: efflux RND transporter periplasmic adaptor subunit [Duncaniella sp.]|nr:efflux RND transporter periplasmic adaptor subunit [Duncaniella sp.]MDE6572592.1 efflux RND transporter periplasmic adaptor subunit [Duncaniella sp.]
MNKSVLISGLIASLTLPLCSCRRQKETDRLPSTPETVSVSLPEVKDIVLAKSYPGNLLAISEIDVMCKVSGQVVNQNFTKGTMVKKGEVLYTIDPSSYRNKVTQAQAALATAKSAYEYAVDHYAAVKKALESDAVSKMEANQAESSMNQAEASVKNAQAALEEANRMLGYCSIVAPISGRIASGIFNTGSYIDGEGTPVKVTTIYDNSTMMAQFAIEDGRYLDILNSREKRDSLGFDNVAVSFAEPLPHTYTAKITYLAPSLNEGTGTMRVTCNIENPYDELRQGMYVKVNFPYGTLKNAILVKDTSICSDQLGKYIYTLNDSNRVVHTSVTLGELYQDSLRVISNGIAPGTRYITSAILKVREGMTVKPDTIR